MENIILIKQKNGLVKELKPKNKLSLKKYGQQNILELKKK